jgi:hypothetical protein
MSRWLAFDAFKGGGADHVEQFSTMFRARQVGRMALVGCTPANDAIIVTSTRALLAILEAHVCDGFFLFGTRPSQAEFAIYGQLSQLGVDPTAQAMLRSDFPLAYRWLAHMEDLSGTDGEWGAPGPMVEPILSIVGSVYLPFLVANAAALERGETVVKLSAMGETLEQPPFRYQAKCLMALRQAFADLPASASADIAPLLARTGCLDPLA